MAEVAGWVSPNPGGVGPMTRAMLLSNIVAAAERQLAGPQLAETPDPMTAPRLGWWWLAAPVLVLGVVFFTFDEVLLAGYTIAAGLGLAALLRLVLPTARSGGLAVRSRGVDVVTMAVARAGPGRHHLGPRPAPPRLTEPAHRAR